MLLRLAAINLICASFSVDLSFCTGICFRFANGETLFLVMSTIVSLSIDGRMLTLNLSGF